MGGINVDRYFADDRVMPCFENGLPLQPVLRLEGFVARPQWPRLDGGGGLEKFIMPRAAAFRDICWQLTGCSQDLYATVLRLRPKSLGGIFRAFCGTVLLDLRGD